MHPEFQIQVQHEMAVGGWEWGSLAILLNGRKLLWVDVERDDAFISAMVKTETEFWDRVQSRNPPKPSEPFESSGRALRALYPVEKGGAVELPLEYLQVDREIQRANEEIQRWQARKLEYESMMKARIGDATAGILPGGNGAYTYKLQTRKAYTVEANEFRVLRRVKSVF